MEDGRWSIELQAKCCYCECKDYCDALIKPDASDRIRLAARAVLGTADCRLQTPRVCYGGKSERVEAPSIVLFPDFLSSGNDVSFVSFTAGKGFP